MKTITLARKPLVGTVAKNVLEHGSGGINVDRTRIGTEVMTSTAMSSLGVMHDDEWKSKPIPPSQKEGRFPANLILNHLAGCKQDGVKKVTGTPKSYIRGVASGNLTAYSKGVGDKKGEVSHNYADEDGKETVANWTCEQGCPVKALDEQSLAGGMHSAGSSRKASRSAGKTGMFPMDGDGHRFGDTGGASRFFKQIGEGK